MRGRHSNLIGFLLMALLTITVSCIKKPVVVEWSYEQFLQAVQQGNIEVVTITSDRTQATAITLDGKIINVDIPANDPNLVDRLSQANVDVNVAPPVERDRAIQPLLILLIPLMILVLQVFWIWILLDCALNEASEGNTKLVWVIIILFTNLLGALIYCFIRRPERRRELGR